MTLYLEGCRGLQDKAQAAPMMHRALSTTTRFRSPSSLHSPLQPSGTTCGSLKIPLTLHVSLLLSERPFRHLPSWLAYMIKPRSVTNLSESLQVFLVPEDASLLCSPSACSASVAASMTPSCTCRPHCLPSQNMSSIRQESCLISESPVRHTVPMQSRSDMSVGYISGSGG